MFCQGCILSPALFLLVSGGVLHAVLAGVLGEGNVRESSRQHVLWERGFGTRNQGGERFISFANIQDRIVVNTWFIKLLSCLPTLYSGNSKTQINFILIRRLHLLTVSDSKALL